MAQSVAPLLIDADTVRSQIVIERFATPMVDMPVTFLISKNELHQVSADVFLDGGSLLAPLIKDLPFKPSALAEHLNLTKGSVAIPLKATDKPLTLRVIFKNEASPSGEKEIIGNALVRLTPPGVLEALLKNRVIDTSKPLKIVVFGKADGLRQMLTKWQLPFVDIGRNPPGSTAADTLMIGETDDRSHLPVLTPQSSLFVLSTDARQDSDTEIYDADSARSTIIRYTGNIDWEKDPKFHRLLTAHLSPR